MSAQQSIGGFNQRQQSRGPAPDAIQPSAFKRELKVSDGWGELGAVCSKFQVIFKVNLRSSF